MLITQYLTLKAFGCRCGCFEWDSWLAKPSHNVLNPKFTSVVSSLEGHQMSFKSDVKCAEDDQGVNQVLLGGS